MHFKQQFRADICLVGHNERGYNDKHNCILFFVGFYTTYKTSLYESEKMSSLKENKRTQNIVFHLFVQYKERGMGLRYLPPISFQLF